MMEELRYELKMVCDGHRLPQVRTWIRLHPEGFAPTFPTRYVNNIYIDTPHLSHLNANLSGISTRKKLRLRWYGEITTEIQPIVELKQKINLLGVKNRFTLPESLDLTRPWLDVLHTLRANIPEAWHPLLHRAVRPTLFNRYRREYFATPDGAIRATIDWEQAAYDQQLSARPNLQHPLSIPDTVIIELKAPPEEIIRLQEAMALFPAQRSRNSKYVNGLLGSLFIR